MPCRTKLFKISTGSPPSNVALASASVELLAVDQMTLANCCAVQTNTSLGGGTYGADLPFTASAIVYEVAIVDTATTYAGATVKNLNGDVAGDIDVVLFKLPPPGSGPGGRSAAQVRSNVGAYGAWTTEQKVAVLSVIDAYASLRSAAALDVQRFVGICARTLEERGIDPAVI